MKHSYSRLTASRFSATLTSVLTMIALVMTPAALAVEAESVAEAAPMQRIISIDGALTEIVYALGAGDRLVAVDTTSRYPQAATALPDVGYMRRLSTEGILALQPDLVIASREAGPQQVFDQLQQAGVEVQRIDAEHSVEGVLHKVDQVARVLKLDDQGAQLRQQIRRQSEAALARIPDQTGPATLFILGAGNRGLMAAGRHTQAQALLDVLAVDNVIDYQGYKPLSVEGALLANPAVVFVAYTGPADHQAFSESLALTDAGKSGRIYALDTSSVLGFGPRIGSALTQLVDMLYPASHQHQQTQKQSQPLAGAE